MEHLPAFRKVQSMWQQRYKQEIPERIRDAIIKGKEAHDPKLVLAAWKTAKDHGVSDPELEALAQDALEAEAERNKARTELALPSHWAVQARGEDATELTRLTDGGLMARIQSLMDITLTGWGPDGRATATRDRALLGHKGFDTRVPTGVVVEQVVQ